MKIPVAWGKGTLFPSHRRDIRAVLPRNPVYRHRLEEREGGKEEGDHREFNRIPEAEPADLKIIPCIGAVL